jgi:uncharacterized iron-regulated membrane protein
MRLRAQLYRWHRWIGLLAGFQLLIWTATGLFMAVVPIDSVRGKHLAADAPPAKVAITDRLLPLGVIVNRHHLGMIVHADLRLHLNRPVYEFEDGAGHIIVRDATTGAQLSPLPQTDIAALARAAMKAPVAVKSLTLFKQSPPIDFRGDAPVWQAVMADAAGTRLYLHPDSGKLLARRTDVWRLYDFLWSLHIMDYRGHEDFNNWLLRIVAGVSLLMTGTGAALLITRYWPRRKTAITK